MTGNQRRRSAFSTVILIASVVLILAVVALYLILSSRLKASQQEYRLYYVSKSSGTLIRSEKRVVLGTDDAAPTPRQLINALLDGPNSAELRSPFPASLHVRSVTESDGLLYIDFSGSYAEIEPFERRLADCCLFQTVSALDGIYSVSLYANGIPLPDGQALTKSSFITQTDFFQSAAADVVFYYPASDLESLHAEARTCTIYQDISAAETVVQILFDDFFRCNPAGVYFPSFLLHSVHTEADVAYVDLSPRFLTSDFLPSTPHPSASDDDDDAPVVPMPDDEPTKSELTGELYLQAIVLSLTELDGINEVQFSFDGQIIEQYSDLKLSVPLKRNRTIPIH